MTLALEVLSPEIGSCWFCSFPVSFDGPVLWTEARDKHGRIVGMHPVCPDCQTKRREELRG